MKRLVSSSCACAALALAPSVLADPPPITADLAPLPLAGIKDDLVYVRDKQDVVRLYGHAQVDLDAHAFYGSGVDSLSESEAGTDLSTRFFLRHARFDLAGEIVKRIAFDGGIELVANPAIDGASADGTRTVVALADSWVRFDAGRGLYVNLGVFQAPFSLENTTPLSELAMMERNVAIRGLVAPGGKALGASIGGADRHQTLHWDAGAFGAETVSPTDFEQHFDAIGRVVARPWADGAWHDPRRSPMRDFQIGLSARAGTRHPRDVTGDISAITTGQGFAMWRPTRTDAFGQTLHVIPSSLQWSVGGELRWPITHGLVLSGEAYWVSRNTRESFDGLQATNTERIGNLSGLGWYAQLSVWPLQMSRLMVDVPLRSTPHADHLELARSTFAAERRGLEIAALGAGINASYDGASRGGSSDAGMRATNLEIYQLGLAVNYWHSNHLRFALSASSYYVPGSGSADNAAVVPGNLGAPVHDPDAHWLFEVGARTSVMF